MFATVTYRHGSSTLPSEFMAEANPKEEFYFIYSDHHLHSSEQQLFFPSVIPVYRNSHYSLRLLNFEFNCCFSCKYPTWAWGCIWKRLNVKPHSDRAEMKAAAAIFLFLLFVIFISPQRVQTGFFHEARVSGRARENIQRMPETSWVTFWFDHKALLLLWMSGRQEECSSFSLFQTSRRGLAHCCLPQVQKRHLVFINENDFHHYLHKAWGREMQSQMITGDVCEDAYHYSEGTHTLRAVHMVTEDGLYNQVGTGTERHP